MQSPVILNCCAVRFGSISVYVCTNIFVFGQLEQTWSYDLRYSSILLTELNEIPLIRYNAAMVDSDIKKFFVYSKSR